MLGFLIVALFVIVAAFAAAVLADSSLRGVRAYRDLSVRAGCAGQYNSVIFKVEQIERSLAQPSFRMRTVNRAINRPMNRAVNRASDSRQAACGPVQQLPVAA